MRAVKGNCTEEFVRQGLKLFRAIGLMSVVFACARTEPDRGGLVIAVSQDGPVDIVRLDVNVQTRGKTLLDNSYRVPQETKLPTTIAVVSNRDETAQATIVIAAWSATDGDKLLPLDRRDAIVTQIPVEREALLRVVLSGRCVHTVKAVGGEVESTCPEGKTCDPNTGDCSGTVAVNAARLGDYRPGDEAKVVVLTPLEDAGDGDSGTYTGSLETSAYTVAPPTSSTHPTHEPQSSAVTDAGLEPPACEDGCDRHDSGPIDGCDGSCLREEGWQCDEKSGACMPICGDGIRVGEETLAGRCDDGNRRDDDGCSSACSVEVGYSCEGEPYHCASGCGNGEVEGDEVCDDGNDDAGDGCFACSLEPGVDCNSRMTDRRVCGPDGDVHLLNLCGEVGDRAAECPGDCNDGSCRCVVRVRIGGSDTNPGSTWAGAKRTIQAAIDAAEERECELWIAAGTHVPWGDSFDRTASFILRPNVSLYGGFEGTELKRSERDWEKFQTILDGGQSAPDATEPRDGVFHVVRGATDSTMDGVVISGGHADRDSDECGGAFFGRGRYGFLNVIFRNNLEGALCVQGGASRLSNCTFEDNSSRSSAQGLDAMDVALEIDSTVFARHQGSYYPVVDVNGGSLVFSASRCEDARIREMTGCISLWQADARIDGSTFLNNYGGEGDASDSGALSAFESTVVIVNSVFQNSGGHGLGAIYASASPLEIYNSRFFGNNAGGENGYGAAVVATDSYALVFGSVFFGNRAIGGQFGRGGAIVFSSQTADVINSTFVDNAVETTLAPELGEGGALAVSSGVVRVVNSIFAGNVAGSGKDIHLDEMSSLEVVSSLFSGEGSCVPDMNCPVGDPQFADVNGGDVTPTSQLCIDRGDPHLLPLDGADLDSNGDTSEVVPLDILNRPRVRGESVDLGAIEAR